MGIMQISKTNNVIFLKNVESNIIDEAFVILKDNVKVSETEEEIVTSNMEEVNVLNEAELLINQKINQNNLEYDKFRIKRLEKKTKILKVMNIITIVAFIICVIAK